MMQQRKGVFETKRDGRKWIAVVHGIIVGEASLSMLGDRVRELSQQDRFTLSIDDGTVLHFDFTNKVD